MAFFTAMLTKIRFCILTASDSGHRGARVRDESGDNIREVLTQAGAVAVDYAMMPDEKELIAEKLRAWADRGDVDIIFTTGGTGMSPRDVTPEATQMVIERSVPGLGEAMRAESLKKTPRAMLSRGIAGIRGRCLIVNLPGAPKAVSECLAAIMPALPHGVEILRGDARECATP